MNLRAEEGERTVLMFAFYTATTVGLSWLESSTVALFLAEYGADKLPWIYIVTAFLGVSLGVFYSWLQQVLSLRWVIVVVSLLMAVPLLVFRFGLSMPGGGVWAGLSVAGITVLVMRLWMEAVYVLSELNTSITANQLFNIREIKRTFPLINSGILLADVIGGFSMPTLVSLVGVPNVVLLACLSMLIGTGILLYLSRKYQQAFPDFHRRFSGDLMADGSRTRLQGPIVQYLVLLFAFFVLAQVMSLLVDFQFLSQLENAQLQSKALINQMSISGVTGFLGQESAEQATGQIASFLGLFQGFLGIFEVTTQWFASSRLIERLGVFVVSLLLPASILAMGLLLLTGLVPTFAGFVVLKFLDEAIRYTLFNSSAPVLFQPLPDAVRGKQQSLVRGIADPVSIGSTGVMMLAILGFTKTNLGSARDLVFITLIVLAAGIWIGITLLLRERYVGLLVLGAERGQLSLSAANLRELKRAVVETLKRDATIEDKRSCVELLSHIDHQNVGDVLAPMLAELSPPLQRQSLEVMMAHPNPEHLGAVRALVDQPLPPEVLAVALRYIWLTEPELDIRQLRPYLQPEVDPIVRGTAASLVLRKGTSRQKAEATNTLRQMLTHRRERERVMGCRALGEAVYMQALRLYIPNLLQDESLRVRCALLEAIAATHLEEYYPSLLRGLYYKSTREAAMNGLVRLENEALSTAGLVALAEDIHKPELVRMHAWSAIGQINTLEARSILVANLMSTWGSTRRTILNILLKIPQELGINAVLDRLGRSGVEALLQQELQLIGQLYAGLIDLDSDRAPEMRCREGELLRRALSDAITDATDRLFLLMKLLYPVNLVQAAAFNLQSQNKDNIARGLEILDNTVELSIKRVLLNVLDTRSHSEILEILNAAELLAYQEMLPSDRLRYLLDLYHFLPDWPLAAAFHLARQVRWGVTPEQLVACLRHPTGFVREAVVAYLRVASPRTLRGLLPKLQNDPDKLVASQVRQLLAEIEQNNNGQSSKPSFPSGWQFATDN